MRCLRSSVGGERPVAVLVATLPGMGRDYSVDLPACDYYYAISAQDCFEVRIPMEYQTKFRARCRMPLPVPDMPWCVGKEMEFPPYNDYDPTGKRGSTNVIVPEYKRYALKSDTELAGLADESLRRRYGGKPFYATRGDEKAPAGIYDYGSVEFPFKPFTKKKH